MTEDLLMRKLTSLDAYEDLPLAYLMPYASSYFLLPASCFMSHAALRLTGPAAFPSSSKDLLLQC